MKITLFMVFLTLSIDVLSREGIPAFEIVKIQKNVFLHKSFKRVEGYGLVSANGLIVVRENKAFLIDTPWSERDTQALAEWIKEKKFTLEGSVSTHSHEDRTAGIPWLNANSIPTYAGALTNDILKRSGRELALHTIEGSEGAIAGGAIQIYYPGGGHTMDNIVVWLPEMKILFGGCLVRSLASTSLGYTGEAQIKQWPISMKRLLLRYADAKLVVPGHGDLGGIQLLNHTKALDSIRRTIRFGY